MTDFTYDVIYLLTTVIDVTVKVAIIISLYKYCKINLTIITHNWEDKDA